MSKLERIIEGKEQQVLDFAFVAIMATMFGFFLGMTVQSFRDTPIPAVQHHYFVCDEGGDCVNAELFEQGEK